MRARPAVGLVALLTVSAAAIATPRVPAFAAPAIRLRTIAKLRQPVAMAPLRDGTLLVVEKGGRLRAIRRGALDPRPLLDLSREVSGKDEQGLLGVAVSPDEGEVFLHFTDKADDVHVVAYPFTGGPLDASRRREVLLVRKDFPQHNGGQLAFGPDGMLYIAIGDGGHRGDPFGQGQRLDTLRGKILRIDPRPTADAPYGVPPDNPFVGRAGAMGEIWAFGFRNPWRFAFDPPTGDIWVADVGEEQMEEIDLLPKGGRGSNYGWSLKEGTRGYKGGRNLSEAERRRQRANLPDVVDPVFAYGRSKGCVVIGGFLYRGSALPKLRGTYLYSDLCGGWLRGLVRDGKRWRSVDAGIRMRLPVAVVAGADGEPYMLSLQGAVARVEPAR